MADLSDIARRLGISVATVSRALRDLPNVSDATRERVRQAATELDYIPSTHAKALATGQSHAIAAITSLTRSAFDTTALESIEPLLRDRGYVLVLGVAEGVREESRMRGFLGSHVDGAIVVGELAGADLAAVAASVRRPIVALGSRVPGLTSVQNDDQKAGRLAAEHLVGLGHRKIAFVSAVDGDREAEFSRVRREAAEAALAEHSLTLTTAVAGEASALGGRAVAEKLVACRNRAWPTAIFAACDVLAAGILLGLREHGVRVPEDLSVIGVDGTELGAAFRLTTVRQDPAGQAFLAVDALLAEIEQGSDRDAAARVIVSPCTLESGATTGPPARGESARNSAPQTAAPGGTRQATASADARMRVRPAVSG